MAVCFAPHWAKMGPKMAIFGCASASNTSASGICAGQRPTSTGQHRLALCALPCWRCAGRCATSAARAGRCRAGRATGRCGPLWAAVGRAVRWRCAGAAGAAAGAALCRCRWRCRCGGGAALPAPANLLASGPPRAKYSVPQGFCPNALRHNGFGVASRRVVPGGRGSKTTARRKARSGGSLVPYPRDAAGTRM